MEQLVKCNLIHKAGFKLMEVSVMEKASGGDTSAQRKPQIHHRAPSVSNRICLHVSRWRTNHCPVWKGSQWE